MNQRGFATIFGLCMILVVAFVVKGIQEAEANHSREVMNFQTEQALQHAAESGIVEAAEKVRESPSLLPYPVSWNLSTVKVNVLNTTKTFKRGEQSFTIRVEVWGERGKIYSCPADKNKVGYYDYHDGVYFMSTATTETNLWSKKIYRRAYAYVLSDKQDDNTYKDHATLHFMELPTDENRNKLVEKRKKRK